MIRHATLKSWNAERTVVADPPDIPKRGSRKDTRRWCRGKVGREHRYEWVESHRWASGNSGWKDLKCVECGRLKDFCSGWLSGCKCGAHKVSA